MTKASSFPTTVVNPRLSLSVNKSTKMVVSVLERKKQDPASKVCIIKLN